MTSIEELLASDGAVLDGHFHLASGKHGAKYLSCAKLLADPSRSRRIIEALAKPFGSKNIDYILGINEAGAILAHGVAGELKTSFALAREVSGAFTMARGFSLRKGSSVLIVDDVTTTGGTVRKLVDLCHREAVNVAGVGLVATKGLGELKLSCPVEILARLDDFDAWPLGECPLCKDGVPLSP